MTPEEQAVFQRLEHCCNSFAKTGVEQSAYYRALGEAKGLNVDKHRKQVEEELSNGYAGNKGQKKGILVITLNGIVLSLFIIFYR